MTTAKPVKCKLDEDDCVTLSDILISFNAAISEEHAWALCYQCGKCFKNAYTAFRERCRLVKRLDQVILHKDGYVHEKSIVYQFEQRLSQRVSVSSNDTGDNRTLSGVKMKNPPSELKLLAGLGYVIFQALDFGIEEDEERAISSQLETILNLMIQKGTIGQADRVHAETDDEGIERDSGESAECDDDARKNDRHQHLSLDRVLKICQNHVGAHDADEADAHYRAVCRALVAEVLELSSFLEKVSAEGGTNDLHRNADTVAPSEALDRLNFQDWARLWMQVIRELRDGVKLKKVVYTRTPIEYELTPYEILMEDIRSQRYKLNKVMIDGSIPARVKKDAHAIILEFIRSRPPLKKASDRQLPPPKKPQFTPRERLLESIKQGNIKLRRSTTSTSKKKVPYNDDVVVENTTTRKHINVETNRCLHERPASTRRLIKVDFSTIENGENEEEEEEDDDDDDDDDDDTRHEYDGNNKMDAVEQQMSELSTRKSLSNAPPSDALKNSTSTSTSTSTTRTNIVHRAARDLAVLCPARSRKSTRRHTIVCATRTTSNFKNGAHFSARTNIVKSSSRDSSASREVNGDVADSLNDALPQMSWSRNSLQEELFESKQWRDECLSLTIEEIVHIRSVLTKAELECLPVEGRVKEDVEKRKICFLCLKTRFSIFGPWGHVCKLCKRTVCAKCHSKMKIPTQHFSHVPVVALSPTMVTPTELEQEYACSLTDSLSCTPQFINSYDDGDGDGDGVSSRDSVENVPPPMAMMTSDEKSTHSYSQRDGFVSEPEPPHSVKMPYSTVNWRTKLPNRTLKTDKLKGVEMIVCTDCKTMVKQIVKSSRTSRNDPNHELTIHLTPIL